MAIPSTLPDRWLIFRARLDGNTFAQTGTGTVVSQTGSSISYTNASRGMQVQRGLFNGSNTFVSYPNLADSNTYHIFVHFRIDNVGANNIIFFEGDTAGWVDIVLQYVQPNGLRWVTKDNTALETNANLLQGIDYIAELYATTAGGGLKTIRINGVLAASVTGCTNVNTGNHANFQIGRLNDWVNNASFLNGTVSALSIYNILITEQERQAHYRDFYRNASGYGTTLIDSTAIVAAYDFGEATGSSLLEHIGSTVGTLTAGTRVNDRFGITGRALQSATTSWSHPTGTNRYALETDTGTPVLSAVNPSYLTTTGMTANTKKVEYVIMLTTALTSAQATELQNILRLGYFFPY